MTTLRLGQVWRSLPHLLGPPLIFRVTSFSNFKVFGQRNLADPYSDVDWEGRRTSFPDGYLLLEDAGPEVSDLEWRTLGHGCQRYGAEASRLGRACGFLWVPKHEHSNACAGAAVCWEFLEGRRAPCAVCDLAWVLVGERTPLEWYSLVWQAGDEGRRHG